MPTAENVIYRAFIFRKFKNRLDYGGMVLTVYPPYISVCYAMDMRKPTLVINPPGGEINHIQPSLLMLKAP